MHTLLFHGRTQTERWSQKMEWQEWNRVNKIERQRLFNKRFVYQVKFHYKLKVEEQDFWDTLYNVFGIKQTLCQSSMIIKFIISIG